MDSKAKMSVLLVTGYWLHRLASPQRFPNKLAIQELPTILPSSKIWSAKNQRLLLGRWSERIKYIMLSRRES
jgi:hypothetical protein